MFETDELRQYAGEFRQYANEFWQYAKEALRRASQSKTENEKNALIDLARTWTLAAVSAERRLIPREISNSQGPAAGGLGWPPRQLKCPQ